MRRLSIAAIGLTLLAATVSAQAAGTLRIGIQDNPDLLDPAQGGTYPGRVVFASLCDKLIDLDAKLNFVPQLATSWGWSNDGRALTLTLREGVTFQDDTPMDAEAVKINLDRYRTAPESVRKAEVKAITAVEVIDPRTIRLVLAQPFAPLIATLADRAGMIASPKAIKALGKEFGTAPVCAGPFKFTERAAQDHVTLDRYPGYWNVGAIHFDRVVFRSIADSTVRLVNLQGGQLDLIEQLAPSDVARVQADPKLRIERASSLGYEALTINVGNGPAADTKLGHDPRVRQALELAIDRNVINQVVMEGQFVPDNQAELPNSPWYNTAFPIPTRDVTKARALLKAAGAEGIIIGLRVPNTPHAIQVGEVIQSMTAEAGITIKVLAGETNTDIDAMNRGDFQMHLSTWSGRSDPDANISIFLASDGFQNWGHYVNPAFDDVLARARAATELARRQVLYRDAAAIYMKDLPDIYLHHMTWLWAHTAKLSGFVPVSDGMIRPQGLMLH
jgi:peptide/nickel transport system substrate-binding protein